MRIIIIVWIYTDRTLLNSAKKYGIPAKFNSEFSLYFFHNKYDALYEKFQHVILLNHLSSDSPLQVQT